jgi:hypothetical protein
LHYAGIVVAAAGFFIAIGPFLALSRTVGVTVSEHYG